MSNRSLDDLNPGDVFKSYGRTVTEADIVMFTCFAGLKLPIFINEEFAKKHTDFGGRLDVVDMVDEGTEDWLGHGTHVAGILGARADAKKLGGQALALSTNAHDKLTEVVTLTRGSASIRDEAKLRQATNDLIEALNDLIKDQFTILYPCLYMFLSLKSTL